MVARSTGARKRRSTVTAAQLASADLVAQAENEAKTDEATAALLAADETTVEEANDDGDDIEIEAADAIAVAAPPDLPPARPSRYTADAPAGRAAPLVSSLPGKIYGPDRKRHMSEMGPVCTTNWIGLVDGTRCSVRYGAPLSTIPMNVRKLLATSRIKFAIALPPERRGAIVVEDPERTAPHARRRENGNRSDTRPKSAFRPIRHLPQE